MKKSIMPLLYFRLCFLYLFMEFALFFRLLLVVVQNVDEIKKIEDKEDQYAT